ncbi:fimbria/pilus outer membrane usher protein [Rahnella sp. AN3-3W3]|uniref:fimbria/pilus outer membrane usher protein n=1 Tax=Rahnella sp. AN3-3W3 TaxID=1610578 RepID=UPI002105465E|nr:fimbria/pilus outer membrane usher protein [Rahnella sp. AN3-3W3]
MDKLDRRGASLRFQYSKDFTESGTTFTLAGYRYSTSGYLDFNEANGFYDSRPQNQSDEGLTESELEAEQRAYATWRYQHNKRSRAQLNVNQTMGNYGSLYLSAYQQQYWGVSGRESNLAAGYNISRNSINYSLNYSWAESPYYSQTDRVISVAVQIPLDRFLPKSMLNLSANQASRGQTVSSAGISGSALADNTLSYSVQQGYGSDGNGTSGSASADYKARFGEYTAGYNYAQSSRQLNYGAMGGVVVHPYGVTFSQPLGDTLALVRADRASGVKVENNTGIYTDGGGYAVVPYLTPYQRNSVRLNTASLGDRVDVVTDTRFVTPGQGALVLADFPTRYGQKVMLTLASSLSIPLGASAEVVNGHQTSSGMVDDRHQVYLSGVPEKGTVRVTWRGGSCNAKYATDAQRTDVQLIHSRCQ